MSNNKQSSIELFAIALYEKGFLQGNGDEINDLLEHHKAIHKEEIEDAFDKGCDIGCDIGSNYDYHDGHNQGYDYYNETYGGNK